MVPDWWVFLKERRMEVREVCAGRLGLGVEGAESRRATQRAEELSFT
jgi:hypothetical protein